MIQIPHSVVLSFGGESLVAELNNQSSEFFIIGADGSNEYLYSFDYQYVRNSLMKIIDLNVISSDIKIPPGQYVFNVLVKSEFDANNSIWNLEFRKMDLKNVYYVHKRLSVYEKMINDIVFGSNKNRLKNIPVPKVRELYDRYTDGTLIPKDLPTTSETSTVAMVKHVLKPRVEISDDDSRLDYFKELGTELALKSVDWIENFEHCNNELSSSIKKNSNDQMALAEIVKNNSRAMQNVYNEVKQTLSEVFKLERGFFSKLFNPEVKINTNDIPNIVARLQKTSDNGIENIQALKAQFDFVSSNIEDVQKELAVAIRSCKVAGEIILADQIDNEFKIRHNRLAKVKSSNDITQIQFTAFRMNFESNIAKMEEIQLVAIPLLISKIIASSGKVDEETLTITKNIVDVKINID